MKRINSLSDLLMEELADLLNAQNQLIEALPKMLEASESPALKIVLEDHLKITKDQAYHLQDILNNMSYKSPRVICKAMKGFIIESNDVVNAADKGASRDAAIISLAQRIEQYEINGYKIACEHAAELGHTGIVELLSGIIDNERTTNLHLNELAQYMINVQAISPSPSSQTKSEGIYIPEVKFDRGGIKKKTKRRNYEN